MIKNINIVSLIYLILLSLDLYAMPVSVSVAENGDINGNYSWQYRSNIYSNSDAVDGVGNYITIDGTPNKEYVQSKIQFARFVTNERFSNNDRIYGLSEAGLQYRVSVDNRSNQEVDFIPIDVTWSMYTSTLSSTLSSPPIVTRANASVGFSVGSGVVSTSYRSDLWSSGQQETLTGTDKFFLQKDSTGYQDFNVSLYASNYISGNPMSLGGSTLSSTAYADPVIEISRDWEFRDLFDLNYEIDIVDLASYTSTAGIFSENAPINVSEPATATLLSLSLLILGFNRRKKT